MISADVEIRSVRVMAVPMPMEVVGKRIAGKAPLGLWLFPAYNGSKETVTIVREDLLIRTMTQAKKLGVPEPLILPKEFSGPILLGARGGNRQALQRIAMYGGALAASLTTGQPWLMTVGTGLDFFQQALSRRIPDLSMLSMELPPSVTLAPGQGITLIAWSAKMRQYPKPFVVME